MLEPEYERWEDSVFEHELLSDARRIAQQHVPVDTVVELALHLHAATRMLVVVVDDLNPLAAAPIAQLVPRAERVLSNISWQQLPASELRSDIICMGELFRLFIDNPVVFIDSRLAEPSQLIFHFVCVALVLSARWATASDVAVCLNSVNSWPSDESHHIAALKMLVLTSYIRRSCPDALSLLFADPHVLCPQLFTHLSALLADSSPKDSKDTMYMFHALAWFLRPLYRSHFRSALRKFIYGEYAKDVIFMILSLITSENRRWLLPHSHDLLAIMECVRFSFSYLSVTGSLSPEECSLLCTTILDFFHEFLDVSDRCADTFVLNSVGNFFRFVLHEASRSFKSALDWLQRHQIFARRTFLSMIVHLYRSRSGPDSAFGDRQCCITYLKAMLFCKPEAHKFFLEMGLFPVISFYLRFPQINNGFDLTLLKMSGDCLLKFQDAQKSSWLSSIDDILSIVGVLSDAFDEVDEVDFGPFASFLSHRMNRFLHQCKSADVDMAFFRLSGFSDIVSTALASLAVRLGFTTISSDCISVLSSALVSDLSPTVHTVWYHYVTWRVSLGFFACYTARYDGTVATAWNLQPSVLMTDSGDVTVVCSDVALPGVEDVIARVPERCIHILYPRMLSRKVLYPFLPLSSLPCDTVRATAEWIELHAQSLRKKWSDIVCLSPGNIDGTLCILVHVICKALRPVLSEALLHDFDLYEGMPLVFLEGMPMQLSGKRWPFRMQNVVLDSALLDANLRPGSSIHNGSLCAVVHDGKGHRFLLSCAHSVCRLSADEQFIPNKVTLPNEKYIESAQRSLRLRLNGYFPDFPPFTDDSIIGNQGFNSSVMDSLLNESDRKEVFEIVHEYRRLRDVSQAVLTFAKQETERVVDDDVVDAVLVDLGSFMIKPFSRLIWQPSEIDFPVTGAHTSFSFVVGDQSFSQRIETQNMPPICLKPGSSVMKRGFRTGFAFGEIAGAHTDILRYFIDRRAASALCLKADMNENGFCTVSFLRRLCLRIVDSLGGADVVTHQRFYRSQFAVIPASPHYTMFADEGDSGSLVCSNTGHALGMLHMGVSSSCFPIVCFFTLEDCFSRFRDKYGLNLVIADS
jgi:hypothetical protein